jgi:hypothetical protein
MTADKGPLASNADLHQYLLQTAESLARTGLTAQADQLRRAAAQGAGLSTEFLGESKIALDEVLRTAGSAMTPPDRNRLLAVIAQIKDSVGRKRP